MDFGLSKPSELGVLTDRDLHFFYYDIGTEHLQGSAILYDWDIVVKEFDGKLDIKLCNQDKIPEKVSLNQIRFTVESNPESDDKSVSIAFFRHLRNAFSHYKIVREGNNYRMLDKNEKNSKVTMRGFIDVKLLQNFCLKLLDQKESIFEK